MCVKCDLVNKECTILFQSSDERESVMLMRAGDAYGLAFEPKDDNEEISLNLIAFCPYCGVSLISKVVNPLAIAFKSINLNNGDKINLYHTPTIPSGRNPYTVDYERGLVDRDGDIHEYALNSLLISSISFEKAE